MTLIKNLKYKIYLITILLLIILVVKIQTNETSYNEFKEVSYTVQPNDTLWSIAGENLPSDVDRRGYIEEVRFINKLNSTSLRIGQEITILQKKGD